LCRFDKYFGSEKTANSCRFGKKRVNIDRLLLEKVLRNDFEVSLGTQVLSLNHKTGTVIFRKENFRGEIKGEILVDAEGARRSLLPRKIKGKGEPIPAVQMDIKAKEGIPDDLVELYFNVPDFFSWIIPLNDSRYRVGVASKEYATRINKLLERLAKKRFGRYKLLTKFGGLVETRGPIKKIVLDKLMVIGDAAGHVKPTTGGGVVFGGLGAKVASEVAVRYLNKKLELRFYDHLWKKFFARELRNMLLMRRVMNLLGTSGMDVILRVMPQMIFDRVKGEFDYHTEALLSIFIRNN